MLSSSSLPVEHTTCLIADGVSCVKSADLRLWAEALWLGAGRGAAILIPLGQEGAHTKLTTLLLKDERWKTAFCMIMMDIVVVESLVCHLSVLELYIPQVDQGLYQVGFITLLCDYGSSSRKITAGVPSQTQRIRQVRFVKPQLVGPPKGGGVQD